MEKQLVQFTLPGFTAEQYDKVWEELRNAGHENPKGLLHHVAGQNGNNWIVNDVWESAEAFNNFGPVLLPFLAKQGVADVQPVITTVYNEYTGQQVASAS